MEENLTPKRPIPPRPILQKVQDTKQEEVLENETSKSKREPLSDQSKSIIFALLGLFALLGGIAVLIVMLVL